jgi:hypothetical protein
MAAGTYFAFEQVARFAEVHLNAFLWRKDDTLRLFSAHNYVGRGRGRLMIYGPSEAREALFPEELGAAVTGLAPYQHAQSIGTLQDGLVILEYLERAYGPTAMPEALLLGITPRFVANIRLAPSPLFTAINRFSPRFTVVEGEHPPRLVPKTPIGALHARAELLSVQPDRFRRGLFAVAASVATTVRPSLASNRRVWGPVSQAKYLNSRIAPDETLRGWLAGDVMAAVHRWDPEAHREEILRQIGRLCAFADRFGIRLYVVNLPEMSWNRELYDAKHYASYMSIVRAALGDTPFLDLRTFIPDDEFYDTSHTMWAAGKRVSRRVAEFIEAQHGRVSHARASE